jgi:hypothetical protein
MPAWESRRVLVLGKTYPSYSRNHDEVACTGGLMEDHGGGLRFVRLHPINFAALPPSRYFSSWQWIRVDAAFDDRDGRPESFSVKQDTIEPAEKVASRDARRSFVETSQARFASLESLMDANARDGASLGFVRPRSIKRAYARAADAGKRREWEAKEREIFEQGRLFESHRRKIDFPDLDLVVEFECDDPRCRGHAPRFHDWGVQELARKLASDPARVAKVEAEMASNLSAERDVYLMMGNFRGHQTNFGIMGALCVPHSETGLFASEPR